MNKNLTLIIILIIGFFVSFLSSGLMFKYELDEVEKTFEEKTIVSTESTRSMLHNLVVVDERLRFLFQVTEEVTDEDFMVLSRTVFSQFPYVKEVVYAPRVQRRNLKTEEEKIQRKGYTGFKYRSFSGNQKMQSRYDRIIYPVKLIQPYTPYTSVWLGRDLLTFKPADAVIQKLSNSQKMQIVAPLKGESTIFYAFSAVSFADDSKKNRQLDFENVFGLLAYELDFIALLRASDIEGVSRELFLNEQVILKHNTKNESDFFMLEHEESFLFEGQTLKVHYQFTHPIDSIDFRIPVLALLLGSLLTILIFFGVKNALERQKILKDQHDVIERKVNEKTELLESQSEAMKLAFDHQLAVTKELESFSYSISHDLRAPLRSISGFANMLREDYGDQLDSTGNDLLSRVERGAGKMNLLIDDLLSLSKISRQEFNATSFSMTDLVNQQAEELCDTLSAKNTRFTVDSDLTAVGDRNLVRIVLNNLLGNAIKYSAKVGSPSVEFGSFEKENKTVYFVKDNGVGFDMTYANKLFVAFQRLHGEDFDGTGIGLATVQRVINRHGGSIWAESELGKGAAFYFTLS